MATGDISKLPKITIVRWFFPSKLISNSCYFSMDWDRVKYFSALVTRYLMIDLGSFLASHKSIFFWRWGGLPPPSNPQTEGGTFPFWQPPDVSLVGSRAEKVVNFFHNISQTKTCVWGPNRTFFSLFEA
jgi:hypothetical protein